MTLEALSTVGIGGEQAEMIAHYASVYADNPGKKHVYANNIVSRRSEYVSYRNDIDYTGTANSQITEYNGIGYNYNVWHSMRSDFEKHTFEFQLIGYSHVSADFAMKRGLAFGWDKVFEAAKGGKLTELKKNSKEIQALGQGLHVLQDAYAHRGRHDVGSTILSTIYMETLGKLKQLQNQS